MDKGLTEALALEVAQQLTAHDALGAHAEAELGIDPDDISSPWAAAFASMLAFTLGALLPLLTIPGRRRAPGSRSPWRPSRSPWRSPAGPAPGSPRVHPAGPSCATSPAGCSRWRITFAIGSLLGTRV